jgi:hypothetical protein
MSQFTPSWKVLFATACLLSSAEAAHALCPIPEATYQGGAFGAYAVTTGPCAADLNTGGGTGSTMASTSSVIPGSVGVSFSLSSTADLATGVLTADSQKGFASSSIWDSFTYTGLPVGGATITATLSLPGTLTGSSDGLAWLEEGPQADFPGSDTLVDSIFFNNTLADAKPPSISLSFNVTNNTPIIVFAEIEASGDGSGGVADLGDPPTLSLILPKGASVATASGVFDNFISATVPEPSTWAMMLLGFAGLGLVGLSAPRARTRSARA